jgi:hypothetical protein
MKNPSKFRRLSNLLAVFIIVALLSFTVPAAAAQAATRFVLVKTILSPTPSGGGFFGQAMAVAGDKFVVGSRDCIETVCGAVHVFDSNGNFVRTIFAPATQEFSFTAFGDSVGAMGSNILVGDTLEDTAGEDAGAAHLFDGATGNLLQTFLKPNPDPGAPFSRDFFGDSVTGFGDDVLVSAPNEDFVAQDAGAVYLFDGATGQLLRTFVSPTPDVGEIFGLAIATVGNNIAIAAVLDGTAAVNGGSVYLFDGNGNLITTIVSPNPVEFSSFGNALAAFGNNLLIAEQRGFTGDLRAGVVHLFDGTTGAFIRSFFNPTPGAFEFFGNSVAASGNNVLIGALREAKGRRSGAAYLFNGTTAELTATLLNPARDVTDSFASQVAAIGNSLLVSSPFQTSNPEQVSQDGVAYLFQPRR